MIRRRAFLIAGWTLAVGLTAGVFVAPALRAAGDTLPSSLTDEEFWRMAVDFSERSGSFQSDNLLSNERGLQYVIPGLMDRATPGGVYLGVGPEQNFTYIATLRPKMAFVVDIRRGNRDLQLMYKALFELSTDRADFVSRLFARKRPNGLSATSTAAEIFAAYATVETDDAFHTENLRAIVSQIVKTHRFSLNADDMLRLQHIYTDFCSFGPDLQYSTTRNATVRRRVEPTYNDLMVATDRLGQSHGYLATEEAFAFVKDFETRNLLVPIIGNFSGPKALRSVGDYLKEKGATVSAFYVSNVEEYLRRDGVWGTFCNTVKALPLDDTSTFIRSYAAHGQDPGFALDSDLGGMVADLKDCGLR